MYSYIIKGGKKLHGETFVSGSKNASLPILAACIISGKTRKIKSLLILSIWQKQLYQKIWWENWGPQ